MKPRADGDTSYQLLQFDFPFFVVHTENLLQNSVDDSWTDSNLNRVSVIQFQEETKGEEEDDEAAAERRVRKHFLSLSQAPDF